MTNSDRDDMVKSFGEQEIKEVIMEMKENSALGPNGFGVSFFKKFWNTLKDDILSLFRDFHRGDLDIKRLNFGVITLVLKTKEAILNVDYKWITKILTNRLPPVAKKMIGPNQTGFIKGRNILEGVVVLHEVVHEC